jgi:hypothetical protein
VRWRGSLLAALGLAASAAPLLPFPAHAAALLCLTPSREQGEVVRVATGPDGGFSLSFIHSVSQTPVTDIYRIHGDEIIQTAEVFQAHGAGLPSFPDDVGVTGWRREGDHFVVEMHRVLGPIHLRVQPAYRNTLHTPDITLPLEKLGAAALILAPCSAETNP